MPILEIPFQQEWTIRGGPSPSTNGNPGGAFRSNVMDEPYGAEVCTRQRPALGQVAATGLSGTAQGITTYNNNVYVVVNNTFKQISGTPTGANGTAWTTNPGTPGWLVRAFFDVVNLNGILFLIGGLDSASATTAQADVWKSTDGGVTWGLVAGSAPFGARYGHRVVVFNGAMYVLGGIFYNSGTPVAVNDVWSSSDGANWTQLSIGAGWGVRAYFGCIATTGGIYVMGGQTNPAAYFTPTGSGTTYNDVWFSTDGVNWTSLTSAAAWGVRASFDCIFYNNQFVIVGGWNQSAGTPAGYNDCWTSTDGRTWTSTGGSLSGGGTGLIGTRLVVYANKMWAIGGVGAGAPAAGNQNVYSSTNPATWALVSTIGASASIGAGAIVVAGVNASQDVNSSSSIFYIGGQITGATQVKTVYNATLNVTFSSALTSAGPAGQPFQFEPFKEGRCLLIKNQYAMWVFEGGVLTQVTDSNYPSQTVPGIVVMGGFAYVMDPTGLIVNCDFNLPLSWPGLNYIGADYESGAGVALDKYLNYVVAFKENSLQLLYDAGNAQGSPLLVYLAGNQQTGCFDPISIQRNDNNLYWVGVDNTGQIGMFKFNGLQAQMFSPPWVNRVLYSAATTNVTTYSNYQACTVATATHQFYIYPINVISQYTIGSLVYDMQMQQWYMWSSNLFATFPFGPWFPVVASAPPTAAGASYMLSSDGTATCVLVEELVQDNAPGFINEPVAGVVQTTLYDNGNNRMKFWGRNDLICDQIPSFESTGNVMQIQVTDDDYQTFSNARYFPVDGTSSIRPALFGWGASRKRAFLFTWNCLNILRVRRLEQEFEQGS
jgi:hypothetical protein